MYVNRLNKSERILLNKLKTRILETTNLKSLSDGTALKIAVLKYLK